MNSTTKEFAMVADYQALVDRIRNSQASADDLDMVHQAPHQRPIAALIGENDAEWLVELGKSPKLKERGAAWRLMRSLPSVPVVREHLREVWMRDNLTDVERNTLLWRVLDDSELPDELHRNIWQWIKTHRDSFVEAFMWYVGFVIRGPDPRYKDVYQLLADSITHSQPPCPPSKRWIYAATAVLIAKNAAEATAAKTLLSQHEQLLKGSFFDEIRDELMVYLELEEKI